MPAQCRHAMRLSAWPLELKIGAPVTLAPWNVHANFLGFLRRLVFELGARTDTRPVRTAAEQR